MRKIVEYKIIETFWESMAREVNKMIAQGWEPIGGLTMRFTDGGNESRSYQAMVRYEIVPEVPA